MVKVPGGFAFSEFGDTNPARPSPSGGMKERSRDPPRCGFKCRAVAKARNYVSPTGKDEESSALMSKSGPVTLTGRTFGRFVAQLPGCKRAIQRQDPEMLTQRFQRP